MGQWWQERTSSLNHRTETVNTFLEKCRSKQWRMLVCSWMTSSTIIVLEGENRRNQPWLLIKVEITNKNLFSPNLTNGQPFSLQTELLNIISQLCVVDNMFPLFSRYRLQNRKESVNHQMNWSIGVYSKNSSIGRWPNFQISLPLLATQPLV